MISPWYYYQAKRALKSCKLTIAALEPDVPDMFLAQRDLLIFEIEHFLDESIKFGRNACLIGIVSCIIIQLYITFYRN